MEHNVDLCKMIGVPSKISCPKCSKLVETGFNRFDIRDKGYSNPSKTKWDLAVYCRHCEHCWVINYTAQAVPYEKTIGTVEKVSAEPEPPRKNRFWPSG